MAKGSHKAGGPRPKAVRPSDWPAGHVNNPTPETREALLIMPEHVADHVRRGITTAVIEAFGGFTAWKAQGAWRNPDNSVVILENVYCVAIAMAATRDNENALRGIAVALHVAGETCVYLRHASGVVEFLERD